MNIRPTLIVLVSLFSFMSGMKMMGAPFSVDPLEFRYDMSLYMDCIVGSGISSYEGYSFGAFVGEECRGVGEFLQDDRLPKPVLYMRIYNNVASGETVTFKAYNSSLNSTYSSVESVEFKNEEALGVPSSPYKVNFKVPVSSITLSKSSVDLLIGDSETISATVVPTFASSTSVSWTSSNATVATVENGVIKALTKGTTVITASADGVSSTCSVTVNATEATGVKLSSTSATLNVNETLQLTATLEPSSAESNLTWSSSDVKIVTVSDKGLVTAVAKGTATITVTTANGKTASCSITVNEPETPVVPEVTGVTLSAATATLTEGEIFQLTAKAEPANASTTFKWSSSDTKIATVNESGLVSAVAAGTAIITVATANGKTATCSVTVKAKVIEAAGITLDVTKITIKVGGQVTLKATVSPDNATDKTVTWSSSNVAVATVNASGLVSGLTKGEATITATCGKVSATCIVTVEEEVKPEPEPEPEPEPQPVVPTSIALSQSSLELTVGATYQLVAAVEPADAKYILSWSSMMPEVASVDENGLVHALAEGTTLISVYTNNALQANCQVTVSDDAGVESIVDNDQEFAVYSLDGFLLKDKADADFIRNLGKGKYILKSDSVSKVILK